MSGPRRLLRPRGLAALVVVLVAGLVLPSCGTTSLARPDCRADRPDTLVVVAQSVRTADLVPCIDTMPPGWSFRELQVSQDGSTLVIASDRAGDEALTVTLDRRCSTAGAKRIPSDEVGTQRFERVRAVSPSYSGIRYYTFPGGCVRYEFRLESELVSGLLNEASLMVGFTSREDLRRRVSELSDGRILDAP